MHTQNTHTYTPHYTRDMKPANILLKRKGDFGVVVLADFGLSKFCSPAEIMRAPWSGVRALTT